MRVVGLTGGIGCGKTVVSDAFSELGINIVDTDRIAHQLTGPDAEGSRLIAAEFGSTLLDENGALNRPAMRNLIFADSAARRQLEKMLHPLIREKAVQQLAMVSSPYAVLVVPLLAESAHFQTLCDRILVVDCDEAEQVERVMQRSSLDLQQVTAIMAAQVSRQARLALAHDILDNSGSLRDLKPRIEELHEFYLGMAHLRKTRE